MQINLRPSDDPVSIRWMRPVSLAVEVMLREQDAPTLPLPTPWVFDRAEWTVLVASGLVHALGGPHGWQDWDEATAFRTSGVNERDHLLIIASLLLQGTMNPESWLMPAVIRGSALGPLNRSLQAMRRLAERAAQYQMNEGMADDVLPWPRVLTEHAGRLLLSDAQRRFLEFPDPSFQAPMLEHLVEETHIDTLVDLAKHGEEATFKELARTLGVAADRVDELWAGTVRRIR